MARAAQRCIMEALDHSRAAAITLTTADGSPPTVALPPAALKLIGQRLGAMSEGHLPHRKVGTHRRMAFDDQGGAVTRGPNDRSLTSHHQPDRPLSRGAQGRVGGGRPHPGGDRVAGLQGAKGDGGIGAVPDQAPAGVVQRGQ